MHAVIMAGGRGTRLQPLTTRVPKPMLQLLDRPMMEYIVELLAMHNVRDITVTVCYLPEAIREYFGDGSKWGVSIRYQEEPSPLGTAGGVKFAVRDIKDCLLVMSGDGLTDFNLSEAISVHKQRGAAATILLKKVQCPLGYGVVDVTEHGKILRFVEKPKTWTLGSAYRINTGIYILEPCVLDYIPADRPFDFGHELFPLLLQQGVPLFGYEAEGYWSDVGTLEQYYRSQLDMIQGQVRLNLPIEALSVN
ncbi:nucleotidyltransferase family protein [Alicyclobacillus curvatus]|nr:nucleotidyltransferase family protein [Alicyclobacillus curvatus]